MQHNSISDDNDTCKSNNISDDNDTCRSKDISDDNDTGVHFFFTYL